MDEKIFKTYTELKDLLILRGMIVEHPRFFTNCMAKDTYYNIINGYKKYFIASLNPEKYHSGTTFEQVYALYSFDQTIRTLFLTELLKIEKPKVSHCISFLRELRAQSSQILGYRKFQK